MHHRTWLLAGCSCRCTTIYAFLAVLSKSALEKLQCDTSFDHIVVDDEQSPRADQMNRDATNTISLLLSGSLCVCVFTSGLFPPPMSTLEAQLSYFKL